MSNALRVFWAVLALAAVAGCAGPAEESAGAAPASSADVVARIGDREITLDEVDAKAKAANKQPYQALYDARKAAVDAIIADQLLTSEAESRGISKDQLLDEEVRQQVSPPTEAEVAAFFEQNKGGMRGRTLDQVSGQIRSYLINTATLEKTEALLNRIREGIPVRVMLDPPRTEVRLAANDPSLGPPDAPITILEFSDFQ